MDTPPVSASSFSYQPGASAASNIDLDAVRHANGDINEIRLLLKGSKETCYRLFREAVEKDDVISQIQLAHALNRLKRGEDQEKDFSSLTAPDLEEFPYYFFHFSTFVWIYEEAMGANCDSETRKARAKDTYSRAADLGYLLATLELKLTEWEGFTDSYGFAAELRPFVGKGNKVLDYYFGIALKDGCQRGSELYYEGMHWMERSYGTPVKYPKKGESFEDFTDWYFMPGGGGGCGLSFFDYDGFRHVGGQVVLAPSEEKWSRFVKERLTDVRIAPPDSYFFDHNPEQISSLIRSHKVTVIRTANTLNNIESLVLYKNDTRVGQISMRIGTFEIQQSITIPALQPVLTFFENIMKRTGSTYAASSWLKHITDSCISKL